jgi:hypothetical protein
MPIWPFGKSRRQAESPLPPELERITEETGQRFVIHLADPAQLDAARQELTTRLGAELEVVATAEDRLEIASSFGAGSAPVMRPLHTLERAGVSVRDLELLDLVTEIDDAALRRLVEAWGEFANRGPHRLRLVRLAGMNLLERCLDQLRAAGDTGHARRSSWSFAVTCVAMNTPGAEERVIEEAARTRDKRVAENLVGAAEGRIRLAKLAGLQVDVPAQAVAELVGRPGYLGERACHLAAILPAPLPVDVTDALLVVAGQKGERASTALFALRNADPAPAVRTAVDAGLASDDPNMRATALDLLAHHWGADARPIWKEFLASKSAPMRWTAEAVIGLHGTREDLADAAAHLAKLARARGGMSMSPPRGNEIVDLLARHRDDPIARAGLDDLSARWDRLPEDLRSWLAEHHPELDPARRDDQPAEAASAPDDIEEELRWPAPTIERRGRDLHLEFDEVGAHQPARERFEELAMAHPAIEVLEGDREWLSVRVTVSDVEALIHELWEAASG